MGQIDSNTKDALKWLCFVLNPETDMPLVKDWYSLLAFAEKQALTGICLPKICPNNLKKEFLLQWIGRTQLIEQQNKLLNKRVEQLFTILEQEGFQCCLLKG